MAHALKYFKEITMSDGRTVRLELHRQDYSGAAKEIGPVMQTFRLEIQGTNNEIDSPIIKTSLTMAFADAPDHEEAVVKKCGDWEEFYTPSSTAWKVVLKAKDAGGSFRTIWGGFVTPDSFSETLRYRGTVTIVARDNIGHMQDFPFDAAGDSAGMISLYDLVNTAWAKIESPMTLDWRGADDDMQWLMCEGVMAYDTLMNVSAFEGKNWYEAVEAALYSYGMVMRYTGENTVLVSSLRSMPAMGYSSPDDVQHRTPEFEAHGERELAPAAKRIEESVKYDLTDGKDAPLGSSLSFTGTSDSVPSGAIDEPVHPVANQGDLGWGNIPSSSLFFNPSIYFDSSLPRWNFAETLRNYVCLAANTDGSHSAWFGFYANPGDFRIRITFGAFFYIIAKIGYSGYRNNLVSLKYAISATANGITQFYNGTRWQTEGAYLETSISEDKGVDIPVSSIDFDTAALIKLTIVDVTVDYPVNEETYRWQGVYVPIISFNLSAGDSASLLENNNVNTVYDENNNVILSRAPELAPAMNDVPFPEIIRNGIFYRSGTQHFPASAWNWSGGTPQQMAVYNHLQLLCYHSKPNNVLSGTIVKTDLTRARALWTWGGSEHMLTGGSFNFLAERLEGATLREFARYDDMWGDVPDTNLPQTEQSGRTNIESGSGGRQTQGYSSTTTVYMGGGGGTTDHSALTNRDIPNQHPIESITGLKAKLEELGSRGTEWYNIHNITRYNDDNNRSYPAVVIENYNEDMGYNDSLYRLVLLRFKKCQNKGERKWRMPMFIYEEGFQKGMTEDDIMAGMRFLYNQTWWPIEGPLTVWFNELYDIESVVNLETKERLSYPSEDVNYLYGNTLIYKATRSAIQRVGVAVYKFTGEGRIGWHRCSNIAYLEFHSETGMSGYMTGIE